MRTVFVNPEVRVLSSYDSRVEGWKISRPYLDDNPTVESLSKMDLMVNSLCSYVFYFRSSILFRDILFTLRPAPAWARSNRTIVFSEDTLKASGEYKGIDDKFFVDKFDEVLNDLKKGIPQDYAKKKLPMSFSTEFTVALDDRTLVAFLKSLKLHCKDLYDVYGKLILEAIGRDESYVDDRVCKDIFNAYCVSEYEMNNVGKVSECMEMFIGSYKMSNNLMAQFIRTSNNKYHNGLWNKIDNKTIKDFYKEMCNDDTVVVVYADKESFKKVLSTRSCYFGQWDAEDTGSWSSIIGPYVENLSPEEFMNLLPCKGDCTKCTIYGDQTPRRDCIEVNPFCPILAEKPSIHKARGVKYNSDSKVYHKWEELVTSGLIKDNPENEDRKLYEKALSTKDDNSEWGLFKNLD